MQTFSQYTLLTEAKIEEISNESKARKLLKFPVSTLFFVSLLIYKGFYLVTEEDDEDRSLYFQVYNKDKNRVKVKIKNEKDFKLFVDNQ